MKHDNIHLTHQEYLTITRTLKTALGHLDEFFKTGAEELDYADAGRGLLADALGMLKNTAHRGEQ